MTEEIKSKPPIPLSGLLYGEVVYWGTYIGSIIAIIASTIAAITFKNNIINPSYVFSAIWEGKDTVTIWETATGALPQGHWYLSNLLTGDGMTMLGIGLGVFAVIPGLFLSVG